MEKKYYSHESAYIDNGAVVGKGTRIWHWCHIMSGAKIGENCNIGENAFVENGVVIGSNVKIKNNVAIYTGVICKDNVFIGPNVVFTNVSNPRSFIDRKAFFKKTIIEEGATIGANATIVCGHDIGKYAFIGAGSVVVKTFEENHITLAGVPAKIVSRKAIM